MPYDPNTGGFTPYTDPSEILETMRKQHTAQKRQTEQGRGSGRYIPPSPTEQQELAHVRRLKSPIQGGPFSGLIGPSTYFGKIKMNRFLRGNIPDAPGQLERENQALLQKYPDSPALKALLGLK